MQSTSIPDHLPAIIGVGQAMQPVPQILREAAFHVELATETVETALAQNKPLGQFVRFEAIARDNRFRLG